MTMPHLMNCPHCEDWCLDCVKKLHDEKEAAEKRAEALAAAWVKDQEHYNRKIEVLQGIIAEFKQRGKVPMEERQRRVSEGLKLHWEAKKSGEA